MICMNKNDNKNICSDITSDDEFLTSTKLNRKRSICSSSAKEIIFKGTGRKRQRGWKQQNPKPRTPPGNRSDDDSGLGADSSLGEDHFLDTSISDPLKIENPTVMSPVDKNMGVNNVPGVIVQTIGFVDKKNLTFSSPKKHVLDMTEEANELPDHGVSHFEKSMPKILSFKNVPSLLVSTNAVQVKGEYIQVPAIQTVHAKHPVTENLNKPLKNFGKLERPKKKNKCHALEGSFMSISSDGAYEMKLLNQPEAQHRARYQTEGSRGAVKDRDGSGHPCVQLFGYDKPTVLQVFVASDSGNVSPHLFYQACKVTGKNSTQCSEEKVEGTTLINIMMTPEKDMAACCDCVGILKERNVDVEHRLKSFVSRGKKSSRCRFVFRAAVILRNGHKEILQVVSDPINCTQPPGIPEIARKSQSGSPVTGKGELFIIGKNFYKDSLVVFREIFQDSVIWSKEVIPEKDFLQPYHLICEIPPYHNLNTEAEVQVQILVISNGKSSDPHNFSYFPVQRTKAPEVEKLTTIKSLPKGVSPNAVKLNQLYAESGGGLPLNDYKILTHCPTLGPAQLTTAGNVKERSVVLPASANKVLVTVNPQVQTTNSTAFKYTNLTPVPATTSTTPTILKPKSSAQSEPNNGATKNADDKENVLENLIQMLRLLNTLPGNLQTPIVELIVKEIQKQFKKEKAAPLVIGSVYSDPNLTAINTYTEIQNVVPKPQNYQNTMDSNNFNVISSEKYHCASDNTVQPTGVYASTQNYSILQLNSKMDKDHMTPKQLNHAMKSEPSSQLNISIPVSEYTVLPNPSGQNAVMNDTSSGIQTLKIEGNVIPSNAYFVRSKVGDQRFDISNANVFQNNMETCNTSRTEAVLSAEISNPAKSQFIYQIPEGQQNLYQCNFKTSHTEVPAASLPKMKQESIMNSSLAQISPQNQVSNGIIITESYPQGNMNSAVVLRQEHCDPLLSQACTVQSLPLGVPSSCAQNTTANGTSLGQCTTNMVSATASDVPITQLSENELLNYINPTCFDNV